MQCLPLFKRIEPLLAGIFKIPERRIDMSQEEVLELIIEATEQELEKRPVSAAGLEKRREIQSKPRLLLILKAKLNQSLNQSKAVFMIKSS